MRTTYTVYGQHIGEEKKKLFTHATKSISINVKNAHNAKEENDNMYAWVEAVQVPTSEDMVEDDNKITLVANFDYDDQAVKAYTAPKSFGQASFNKFDAKVDAWLERSLGDNDLQTLEYFYKGVSYSLLEDLYKEYSSVYIDPYY